MRLSLHISRLFLFSAKTGWFGWFGVNAVSFAAVRLTGISLREESFIKIISMGNLVSSCRFHGGSDLSGRVFSSTVVL